MLKASLFLLFCGLLLSLAEYSQAESNTPICESYSSSNFNGLNFEIKSYTANLKLVKLKNSSEIYVALRTLNTNYQVLIQKNTLETVVVSKGCIKDSKNIDSLSVPGQYGRILQRSYAPPEPLHNDGVTHSFVARNEYFLTTDLCPSKKPLDYSFYQNLATEKRQTPVGIALSGGWMRSHKLDLDWLKELAKRSLLKITWMNHSDTHPYKLNTPDSQTFLLTPGVDLKTEVLNAEIQFLKNGILPSVYFRFPGLISNQEKMHELQQLGLIPLGSSAWLARGDRISAGSIILVHGNGNEPLGLSLFNQWISTTKNWFLLKPLINLFD